MFNLAMVIRLQAATEDFLLTAPAQGLDVGEVFGAGVADCHTLDKVALARFEERGGRVIRKDAVVLLEADWLCTSTGFFYVVPRVQYVWWGRWSDIRLEAGRASRFRWRPSHIVINHGAETLEFGVARSAVADVVEIAQRFGGLGTGSG